jgi:hypothetical protein
MVTWTSLQAQVSFTCQTREEDHEPSCSVRFYSRLSSAHLDAWIHVMLCSVQRSHLAAPVNASTTLKQ